MAQAATLFKFDTLSPTIAVYTSQNRVYIKNLDSVYVRIEMWIGATLIASHDFTTANGYSTTFPRSFSFPIDATQRDNIYAATPNSLSVPFIYRVKSYSDSAYSIPVGVPQDYGLTWVVDPDVNRPVFLDYDIEEVNKNINIVDKYGNVLNSVDTQVLTGSSNKIIKGVSDIKATVADADRMVPQNSATGDKYVLTVGSQVVETNFGIGADREMDLTTVTSKDTSVGAIDSRGLVKTVTKSFALMAEHTPLAIAGLSLERDNAVDPLVQMSFSGTFWKKWFSSNTTTNPGSGMENTLTVEYRFKESSRTWQQQDGTFTVTIASPAVFTKNSHGFVTGQRVYLETTGALPTGLTAGTYYYVINNNTNTFWLATSEANALAGTKINTSGSQSGTHTIRADSKWEPVSPSTTDGNILFSTYIDGDLGAGGFSVDKSFTIELRAYDLISHVILEATLDKGTPLVDYTKDGMAVMGQYDPSEGGSLQVDGHDIKKNHYKFRVYRGSSQTLSAASFTKIQFTSVDYDTENGFDETTNYNYTAPIDGYYHFSARVSSIATMTTYIISLFVNGNETLRGSDFRPSPNAGGFGAVVSGTLFLNAGDVVDVRVFGNGAFSIETGSHICYFDGFLISQ